MSDKKQWRIFEKNFQAMLKELQQRRPMLYHRFQDTKAARGAFLPVQPGDYMTVCRGHATLIELKSSLEHASLRSCAANAIKPEQLGKHRIWLRAGASSLFVFEDSAASQYEVWFGYDVVKARSAGTALPRDKAVVCENWVQLSTKIQSLLLDR